VFADMPPSQPEMLAGWLTRALGGPIVDSVDGHDSDPRQAIGHTSAEFIVEHRARWVSLVGIAADEARLPADRGFRSAFASCIDWVSRAALTHAESGSAGQPGTLPRWGWGPGGPPPANPAKTQAEAEPPEQPLPGPAQPVGFAAHIKPLLRHHPRGPVGTLSSRGAAAII
jgi:hemoglobin